MIRVKTRTFSGAVCEQMVFSMSEKGDRKNAAPRPRFKTPEDREKHRAEISRRHHAQLVNENFRPGDLYSTLTFDDENEVLFFKDAKRIRDNFRRRLRRKYPDAVIFLYLGRGKNTERIHMHGITHGIPEEELIRQWPYGEVRRIVKLRENCKYDGVDYGADYTGLANYLWGHWTPEQGGKRWSMSGPVRQPVKEPATPVRRNYSETKAPYPPKGYRLVEARSTPYGYLYFKYVKDVKRE